MPDKYPMTPECLTKLRKELRYQKSQRPVIADVILEARELGDLSENAEYHAAKEKQGMMAARIRELEGKITLAEVIDPSRLSGDRVMFGAAVEVEDCDSGETATYIIVGEDESDAKAGFISITSPIARGLINHTAGDEVRVKVPGGMRNYEIVGVSFDWVRGEDKG